jgi:hypothetical protein
MRERIPGTGSIGGDKISPQPPAVPDNNSAPANGTIVLDVEPGGIVVPSFAGKSVRSAIETAEADGLDLDIVGDGVAQDQSPPAGSRVGNGTRITVHFGR